MHWHFTCTLYAFIITKKFNRRAKEVQSEEQDMWKHLQATDMSEESEEEGTLVVHKPAYRSTGMCKISV